MPISNFWRLSTFDLGSAQRLELKGLRLIGKDAESLPIGAAASSVPAASGDLQSILGVISESSCVFDATEVRRASFYIDVELVSAADVAAVQLAAGEEDGWPQVLFLSCLTAGQWVVVAECGAYTWPGDGVFIANPVSPIVGDPTQQIVMNFDMGVASDVSAGTPLTTYGPVVSHEMVGRKRVLAPGGYAYSPSTVSLLTFGTGDFTVEGWFTLNANSADAEGQTLVCVRNFAAGISAGFLKIETQRLGWSNGAVWLLGSGTLPLGRHHFAVSRAASALRLFVDGSLVGTYADGTNYSGARMIYVGRSDVPSGITEKLQGSVEVVRVVKGVALYTAPFTPPSAREFGTYYGKSPKPTVQTGYSQKVVIEGAVLPQGLGSTEVATLNHIDLEVGGQGSIYGTVELYAQAGNIPLPRRVRLHRSRDGLLVRETWSDAQGNYRFDGITERYTYDVIAWDHEGLQQSVVANDLTPEVMQ